MNARSTDYEADAVITTPLRRYHWEVCIFALSNRSPSVLPLKFFRNLALPTTNCTFSKQKTNVLSNLLPKKNRIRGYDATHNYYVLNTFESNIYRSLIGFPFK